MNPQRIVQKQIVALDMAQDEVFNQLGGRVTPKDALLQAATCQAVCEYASAIILTPYALDYRIFVPVIVKADQGRDEHGRLLGLENIHELTLKLRALKDLYGIVAAKARAPIDLRYDAKAQIDMNQGYLQNLIESCQRANVIAVPEWDVLVKGDHTLQTTYAVTSTACNRLDFSSNSMLKVNLITPNQNDMHDVYDGQISSKYSMEKIMDVNLDFIDSLGDRCIAFLSGGIDTKALQIVRNIIPYLKRPELVTTSFGRGAREYNGRSFLDVIQKGGDPQSIFEKTLPNIKSALSR